MALMKREPRKSLFPSLTDIEKLFEDDWFDWRMPIRRFEREFLGKPSLPAMDIYEDDQNLYLKAELPGVDEKDIHLEVVDNALILKAERKEEEEEKGKNYYRREQSYGMFERSFTLPQHVKTDEIKAKLEKGVLHVTMPKSEEVKPKKIAIESGK